MNVTQNMTVTSILANDSFSNDGAVKVLIDLGQTEVKDAKRMFRTVCAIVLRSPDMREAQSLEEFMNIFGDILEAGLPEGVDAPIAAKTKKPSFRSWPVTKVRWQYANYIYNAIEEQGGIDQVFPPAEKLPTLSEVRKLMKQKSGENAIDTIKRSIALCEQKLEELSPADFNTADSVISSLMVKWGNKLSEVASTAPATGTDG